MVREINTKKKIEKMQKKDGLFCLEWAKAKVLLQGSWKTHSTYTAIDVSVGPCTFEYTAFDGTRHGFRDDCIDDYAEVERYLGSTHNMVIFYNAGFFR